MMVGIVPGGDNEIPQPLPLNEVEHDEFSLPFDLPSSRFAVARTRLGDRHVRCDCGQLNVLAPDDAVQPLVWLHHEMKHNGGAS